MAAIATPMARAQTPPAPPAPKPAAPTQTPAATTQPPPTTQNALPPSVDFRKGVLYGRVLDVQGKPVPEATVALQDSNGKVMAWTKTNAQGEYALAADPTLALHLNASRRRGLLEQIARSVGDVAMTPVKVAASVVANPGKTLQSATVSVATGTPLPLAAQVAQQSLGDKNVADETGKKAREVAAKTAVGAEPASPQKKPVVEKGEAQLLVSCPNFKETSGKAGAYWLEGPSTDKDKPLGMQAWLETVKLAPTAGEGKCEFVHEALLLAEPTVEPTLIPAGGMVKIRVKLQCPPGPEHKVRVFARESHKDTVVELLPQDGADKNVYAGTMTLDPQTPAGETVLTIAAFRAEPVEVKLDKKKTDPLLVFVQRVDEMDAKKPYAYDPRIMASENRLDIKLNVLDVKKGTPPAPTGKS